MTNKALTTDEIHGLLFAKGKLRRYGTYHVPGFGTIRVQSLTERERAGIERAVQGGSSLYRPHMVALAVVDDEGRRVFTDGDVEDLAEVDSRLMLAIADTVAGHIGPVELTAEDLEGEVKN
jgi:hypothetical protein